jgi:hypothetical protein
MPDVDKAFCKCIDQAVVVIRASCSRCFNAEQVELAIIPADGDVDPSGA